MLKLERRGMEVFCEGKKLTVVAQATKGVGKEVVKVEGLEGANGQKWVSLSKLKEGMNEVETQGREVTSSYHKEYELTKEEQEEVNEHKKAIEAIIAKAKERYVKKPKLLTLEQAQALPEDELNEYIEQLKAYYKK